MSTSELTVSFLCLIAGYALVSWLLNRTSRHEDPPSPLPPPQRPRASPSSSSVPAFSVREPAWHEVLGVSPAATREQIKAAYREQISQYHPDKVARLGQEIRAVAERKSAQLNAAYDQALKSR